MFRPRHRLHRLRRLHRLHSWNDWAGCGMGTDWSGRAWRGGWGGSRTQRRKAPGAARILLAGIAALAFARLFSAAQWSNRSRAEKFVIGVGLTALAALLLSLRRSTARYRW